MFFKQTVAQDPLSTALDRAIAEHYDSVGAFNNAIAISYWDALPRDERAARYEREMAELANWRWDVERERDLEPAYYYSHHLGVVVRETAAERDARVACLNWRRAAGGRWEFVGRRAPPQRRASSPIVRKADKEMMS